MHIIRVFYYYTCIVRKQDNISIPSCYLWDYVIKTKKLGAIYLTSGKPKFNLFPVAISDLIVNSRIINKHSLKSLIEIRFYQQMKFPNNPIKFYFI